MTTESVCNLLYNICESICDCGAVWQLGLGTWYQCGVSTKSDIAAWGWVTLVAWIFVSTQSDIGFGTWSLPCQHGIFVEACVAVEPVPLHNLFGPGFYWLPVWLDLCGLLLLLQVWLDLCGLISGLMCRLTDVVSNHTGAGFCLICFNLFGFSFGLAIFMHCIWKGTWVSFHKIWSV